MYFRFELLHPSLELVDSALELVDQRVGGSHRESNAQLEMGLTKAKSMLENW